jgi:uncharacterized protein
VRIGLISDTHGLLRPEVFPVLAGVERILHAGDVGRVEILDELESIAPVTAVWGNTDGFDVRGRVGEQATLELRAHTLVLVHGHQHGSPAGEALLAAYPTAGIVVYGHTHRPLVERLHGRLAVNPGAAGPARFRLAPSVGILTLDGADARVEIVELGTAAAAGHGG